MCSSDLVMSIVTDSKGLEEPKEPENCNVAKLYKLMATPAQYEELCANYRAGNFGYGHAKLALFELLNDYFGPMRKRRAELEKDPGLVDAILKRGAERARGVACATMDKGRRAVGLR